MAQNKAVVAVGFCSLDPDLVQLASVFYAQKPETCIARLAQVHTAHQDAVWFYDALEHRALAAFDDSDESVQFTQMMKRAGTSEKELRGNVAKYEPPSSKELPVVLFRHGSSPDHT